jgi:hypothetical protein
MSKTLQDALMGADGPVEVTRIEIELLDNCRFRWKLHSEGGLIYAAVGDREQVDGMIDASRVIVDSMLGLQVTT